MTQLNYRLACLQDKNNIINFMDENWGSKHPLIHVEKFFNYYYNTRNDNVLNFAVAETCDDLHEIKAICGFIPCNKASNQIWVSIWCAKKEKGSTGIGLELMSRMGELTGATLISCNNIRPNTMAFYQLLGYTAERIPHFYKLAENKKIEDFNIAKIEYIPFSQYETCDITLELIQDFNLLSSQFTPPDYLNPYKDLWHIKRRYFDYPFQKYNVYLCKTSQGIAKALLVIQKIITENTCILRIVDYIGDTSFFAKLGTAVNSLVNTEKAEYIDCYVYGVSQQIMNNAGFTERKENDQNIIPNYLLPPLYENTEYYFFTTDNTNFTMWKADGDQNRPNITV